MEALKRVGATSVPVVAVGDKWVFGQSLDDVARLTGIEYQAKAQLTPEQLVEKLDLILAAAQRYLCQFPADKLDTNVRDRKRTYRNLGFHIFRLQEAFLEVATGAEAMVTRELLNTEAPADMATALQITAYGDRVRKSVRDWWEGIEDSSCQGVIETYYGPHSLHDVLERFTWHSGQHVRQLMLLLREDFGTEPDRPLSDDDLAGLPLPVKVWDD